MASANKKKKLKNSYCTPSALKDKDIKIKRLLFYNSSKRQEEKRKTRTALEQENG